ncbi:dual specificity phosphatase [Klosneuvirus KNV1]|uniref:Dual specificity phosphatase n=1 Tax=Klosneuvirus KNV1 TaxID=1977640 RepID=A0A1V0SI01_9VIRU|nr:dual specificity phosphatase [Klosneuvirus KNV1]
MKQKCMIKEYDVNEVIPNLWLGNCKSAYNHSFLKKYNIKYIITIMDEFDEKFKYNDINYLVIPLKDSDICYIDMFPIFEKTSKFINYALKNNKGVLVHCKNGHHRSAAIVAAFIIKRSNIDYHLAISYIKKLRPCAFKDRKCITEWLHKYYLRLHA